MPKLTNSLPSYRKHKLSGQVVVTLGGKDFYLGPHGTKASKTEYDRLVSEWLASGRRAPTTSIEESVCVDEVLLAYWNFAQGWYVKNGKQTNEVDAFRVIIRDCSQLYGETLAAEFGPIALRSIRQVWIDRGNSRPTINKNAGRLKRIFKWAASQELIPVTVYQALATVDGLRKGRCDCPEPDPVKPVATEVVKATLPHLPKVNQDMIWFQLLTGARPGEVCMMTPDFINRKGEIWEYRVDGHKTEHHGRSRTIYVGPEAQSLLAPYLLRTGDAVCFSMRESVEQRRAYKAAKRKTPLSCGNRRGKKHGGLKGNKSKRKSHEAFNTGTYRNAIHRACDLAFPAAAPLGREEGESDAARMRRLTDDQKAKLKVWQDAHRWSPNQLRHTRGTEIRAKFGLEAAQVILGHAAADVTQVYAERDAEKARAVAKQIG